MLQLLLLQLLLRDSILLILLLLHLLLLLLCSLIRCILLLRCTSILQAEIQRAAEIRADGVVGRRGAGSAHVGIGAGQVLLQVSLNLLLSCSSLNIARCDG